ncbi:hypothetical protein [Polaribacter sp.]|uniref:hypothetical protein n=1 Tax=Polaribacter sp. TaxID=1920175 RepID=UPI003EF3BE81
MKNSNKILSVFLLITIYCFGIYIPANTSLSFGTKTSELEDSQKEYLTTNSTVAFSHTLQLENLFSEISEYSYSSFQLSFEGFLAIFYSNELLLNAKFKQYKSHFKTLLIRHRKSDLIFPFHNFW